MYIAKVRARRLGYADVVLRLQNGDAMLDRGAPEEDLPSLPGTAAIKTTGVDARQPAPRHTPTNSNK
jgi:hypothetical protein